MTDETQIGRRAFVSGIIGTAALLPASARPQGFSQDQALAATVTLAVDWSRSVGNVGPEYFGHNTVWSRGGLGVWNEAQGLYNDSVLPLLRDLSPGILRFPGGARAMRYDFSQAIGETRTAQCDPLAGSYDSTRYGLDEFLRLARRLGSQASLVTPWAIGSPQLAAAMVAYVNGTEALDLDLGSDEHGRNWGQARDWARRRATNGHAEPYGVRFVEVGNEQYLDVPVGPLSSCDWPIQFRQNYRWVKGSVIPTTARDHAEQVAASARLIKAVDPTVLVGASAYAEFTGADSLVESHISEQDVRLRRSDPWNIMLLEIARDDFDYFILHPYRFDTSEHRIELGDYVQRAIRDLRRLAPEKQIAITEFGFILDGDTLLNALMSADVIRVAIEEQILHVMRHILIEDDATGLFAHSAAILGPEHQLTPAYHVIKLMRQHLQPVALSAQADVETVKVAATTSLDGRDVTVLIIDRRTRASGDLNVALPLPAGRWTGTVQGIAGSTLQARADGIRHSQRQIQLAAERVTVTVPNHSVSLVTLSQASEP